MNLFWLILWYNIFHRKVYYYPKPYIALDLDWFYRRPARIFQKIVVDPWDKSFDRVEEFAFSLARKLVEFGKNPYLLFTRDKSDKTYTPDRYRPAAQKIVLSVLALFILVSILAFFLKK